MDLFELMGISPDAKKEEHAKSKKITKVSKNKEKSFILPMNVLIPYSLPVEIEGVGKITESELNKRYCDGATYLSWSEFTDSNGRRTIIGKFKMSEVVTKGIMSSAKEIKIGNSVIPNTLTEYDTITEMLAENGFAGCQLSYVSGKDCIIPVITSCSCENADSEDKKLFLPGIDTYSLNSKCEREVLEEIFGEASSEFKIWDNGDKLIAVLSNEYKTPTTISGKEEYDISSGEVILSLVWNKFSITPSLFGGKNKVTKEQLCSYIIAQGYPEYSSNRTTFEYADKNNRNLLIAILKGSSKGADEYTNYSLSYEFVDGVEYRHEVLPWGEFYVSTNMIGMGNFKLMIPKIPATLLCEAYNFFNEVFVSYGTEAALQLFFKPAANEYYWYVPKQTVSIDSVYYERDAREYTDWLIADFHSHGHFPAGFSNADNADEKGTRLYGVMGTMNNKPTFCFRAGCGGHFLHIPIMEVFEPICHSTVHIRKLSIENVNLNDGISSDKCSPIYN